MKKLVLLAFVAVAVGLTTSYTASAQGISVELDLGYNSPTGDFGDVYDGGVAVALHPRFKLNDKMAVGISAGVNGFVGGDYEDPSLDSEISAAGIVAVMGTFQYKLLGKKITPYGELGIGMFNGTVLAADASGTGEESVSNFGFAPEVGVMIGFLNASVTYATAGDISYTQFGVGFRFGAK